MNTKKRFATFVGILCFMVLLCGLNVSAESIVNSGTLKLPYDRISGVFTEENNAAKYYKVVISTPGCLKVDFMAEYYQRLLLLSASGEELRSSDRDINDSGTSHQEINYYLNPGTYYVGFGALRGLFITTPHVGSYTLTTSFQAIACDETESNDTLFTANPTTVGRTMRGMIAVGDEKDFYRIHVGKGKYTLAYSADFDIEVKVYTTSGDEKGSFYQDVDSSLGLAVDSDHIELDSGTYCVLVKARRGNTGTYQLTVKNFTGIPISKASISNVSRQTYSGRTITPYVSVTYNGRTLSKGRDYNIVYKKNRKPGKASIVIQGIGDYSGTKTKNFVIVPKSPILKTVRRLGNRKGKVAFSKSSGASGYQIWYSSNFRTFKKITTKKRSYILKKLKKNRYYCVKVRAYVKIGKKKYYGPFSYSSSVWM
ncbi:MAG: hypothetical protein UDG86_13130 [Lachnospiraceae bacterium]|nr:hypothetical protein [Lachnospiraceae bacterium]